MVYICKLFSVHGTDIVGMPESRKNKFGVSTQSNEWLRIGREHSTIINILFVWYAYE